MSETYATGFSVLALGVAASACYLAPKVMRQHRWLPPAAVAVWMWVQRKIAAGPNVKHLATKGLILRGKVAVITGANSGIGYYTALRLAELGCTVVITCRNEDLVNDTIKRMHEDYATRQQHLVRKGCDSPRALDIVSGFTLVCDDFESVKNFCFKFEASGLRCDILVNNAGMMVKPLTFSSSNPRFELHTAVNFLGQVLLTELMMPHIKKSQGRVVNVASEAHRLPELLGPEAATEQSFLLDKMKSLNQGIENASGVLSTNDGFKSAFVRYGVSKLCNVYHAHFIATHHGVPVCSLHPGCVATGFSKNVLSSFGKKVFDVVSLLFFKTQEEGAETTIFCCTCPENNLEPKLVRGGLIAPYFVDCCNKTSSLLRPVGWNIEAALSISQWAITEVNSANSQSPTRY